MIKEFLHYKITEIRLYKTLIRLQIRSYYLEF